jgi:lysophospholipase L1-like esterase
LQLNLGRNTLINNAMPQGFDIIARIILLPLLLVQCVIVRMRALSLPEATGPRRGCLGQGPLLRVLMVGDSSAAGVGTDTQDRALVGHVTKNLAKDHRVEWVLFAKTGDTTASTLARLRQLPLADFDLAIVVLGVNDATRFVNLRKWTGLQQTLARRLRTEYGAQQVFFSALPPLGQFPLLPQPLAWVLGAHAIRLDDALNKRCASDPALHYVPMELDMDISAMAPDGYHPGPKVYAAWGNTMADFIRRTRGNLTAPRS